MRPSGEKRTAATARVWPRSARHGAKAQDEDEDDEDDEDEEEEDNGEGAQDEGVGASIGTRGPAWPAHTKRTEPSARGASDASVHTAAGQGAPSRGQDLASSG